jgi:hypothetical protein
VGLLASITKLDRNFGWSFLGFVLAAVFGALSLYTEFWKEAAPHLEFEVLSNAPVLDVREKLPDLEVLYQSQDIAKSGKTLSVLLVRAVNRGSADILSSLYDPKAPVGLNITGGSLIRADLSDTSNEYLRGTATVVADTSSVTLAPVIMEREEWFVIKLLVLHNTSSQPTIAAYGKVAGQRAIPVLPSIPVSDKEGFWHRAFSGSVWTQLVRIPAYFFITIAVVMAIVIPTSSISDAISNRKRKAIVERFKAKTKLSLTDSDEFIFQEFIRGGLQYVQRLTNAVADQERLQKSVARYFEEKDRGPSEPEILYGGELAYIEMSNGAHRVYPRGRFADMKAMIKHGFINKEEERWVVAPDRLKVATSFIEYVELVGAMNV